MTKDGHFERKDIEVSDDIYPDEDAIENDCFTGIEVRLETYFDCGKKFGVILDEDDWIILYAYYNPESDDLTMLYYVDRPNSCTEYCYTPYPDEKRVVIDAIIEKIRQLFNQTPMEFLQEENENS